MNRLIRTIGIATTFETIRRIAFDPGNWHLWYSNLGPAASIEGDGSAGTSVRSTYQLAGVRIPVTITVVDIDESDGRLVWRATLQGALSGQQAWDYTAEGGGLRLAVDFTYQVPDWLENELLSSRVIGRLQEQNLEQMLANLKLILEEHSAAAVVS